MSLTEADRDEIIERAMTKARNHRNIAAEGCDGNWSRFIELVAVGILTEVYAVETRIRREIAKGDDTIRSQAGLPLAKVVKPRRTKAKT